MKCIKEINRLSKVSSVNYWLRGNQFPTQTSGVGWITVQFSERKKDNFGSEIFEKDQNEKTLKVCETCYGNL